MERNTDPFAALLGMAFSRRTDTGIVTKLRVKQDHLNPYRIAHGGVGYTCGCVTAQWSAAMCLDRDADVCAVSSQYLAPLREETAECESRLLDAGEARCTYEVTIRNERRQRCFLQLVTLRFRKPAPAAECAGLRTIFPASEHTPPDPATGLRFPMPAPGPFCALTQEYLLASAPDGTEVGADIFQQTSDGRGAAHCGLIYTCCDTGAGALSGRLGKIAVTVSSSMEYFRPATVGPVRAEVRCVRDGNTILYYRVTAADGNGKCVAAGQFCLHPVGELTEFLKTGDGV